MSHLAAPGVAAGRTGLAALVPVAARLGRPAARVDSSAGGCVRAAEHAAAALQTFTAADLPAALAVAARRPGRAAAVAAAKPVNEWAASVDAAFHALAAAFVFVATSLAVLTAFNTATGLVREAAQFAAADCSRRAAAKAVLAADLIHVAAILEAAYHARVATCAAATGLPGAAADVSATSLAVLTAINTAEAGLVREAAHVAAAAPKDLETAECVPAAGHAGRATESAATTIALLAAGAVATVLTVRATHVITALALTAHAVAARAPGGTAVSATAGSVAGRIIAARAPGRAA